MTHAGGCWNVGQRAPKRVATEVAGLVRRHDRDWYALQETKPATIRRLREELSEYRVVGYSGYGNTPWTRRAAANTCILVHQRIFPGGGRASLHKLDVKGWPRLKRSGMHWPNWVVSIDLGPYEVVSVHLPPPHGRRRNAAWGRCRDALVDLFESLPSAVAAGDYNKRAGTAAVRDTVKRMGAKVTGTRIDFAVAKGVTVSNYERIGSGGSDHAAVLFDVTHTTT